MLAGVVDEIFGVGQLQLACAFVINMSGPINSPAIMPSQVSKAHSRTSPFALRQCYEKYCSPACRMQVLKQEKRAFSKCYPGNLTQALTVNVDRISPGPFFSGL